MQTRTKPTSKRSSEPCVPADWKRSRASSLPRHCRTVFVVMVAEGGWCGHRQDSCGRANVGAHRRGWHPGHPFRDRSRRPVLPCPLDDLSGASAVAGLVAGIVVFLGIAAWQVWAILRSAHPATSDRGAVRLDHLLHPAVRDRVLPDGSLPPYRLHRNADAVRRPVLHGGHLFDGRVRRHLGAKRDRQARWLRQMIFDLIIFGVGIKIIVGAVRSRDRATARTERRPWGYATIRRVIRRSCSPAASTFGLPCRHRRCGVANSLATKINPSCSGDDRFLCWVVLKHDHNFDHQQEHRQQAHRKAQCPLLRAMNMVSIKKPIQRRRQEPPRREDLRAMAQWRSSSPVTGDG